MAFLRLIYFTARRKCPQFGFDRELRLVSSAFVPNWRTLCSPKRNRKYKRLIAILRDYDRYGLTMSKEKHHGQDCREARRSALCVLGPAALHRSVWRFQVSTEFAGGYGAGPPHADGVLFGG